MEMCDVDACFCLLKGESFSPRGNAAIVALLEAVEGKMSYKLTLRREKKTRLMNRDCVRRKCNEG